MNVVNINNNRMFVFCQKMFWTCFFSWLTQLQVDGRCGNDEFLFELIFIFILFSETERTTLRGENSLALVRLTVETFPCEIFPS